MTARRSARAPSPRAPKATPSAPKPVAPGEGIPLGRSGQKHPPFGVGLWNNGRWDVRDVEKLRAAVTRALEVGIPWLDTAEVYGAGRSERLLGDALSQREAKALQPFISTKLSWEHLRPSMIRPALLGSAGRLGVGRIDAYLIHAPDPAVPIPPTMQALETLQGEGRFQHLGVSNFALEDLEIAQGALPSGQVVINQIKWNLLEPGEGPALRDYCRKNGVVLEAYTPLAGGVLAGRFLDGKGPTRADSRSRRGAFKVEEGEDNPLLGRARQLRDLAKDAEIPLASVALHWLARQGAAPLVGVSSPAQVDQLLELWAEVPTQRLLDRAEEVAGGVAA
jgi:aryl-alcohol dehydrogenase-like predicted oxidoreductase